MAKIAVIGAGAVGSYYGALLARAGHDVRFLFRRDLEAVRERGLDVRSVNGNFRLRPAQAFASAAEIGECEWVLCSLKATAIEAAEGLVAPCVGPGTRILALMNGLGIEQRFARWFDAERVFGGMAFVCINRGDPGVVHHLQYGRINIGHYKDDPVELERLRTLLASGGIEVAPAPNLRWARWEKLCWNIPFNGLSVAAGGVGTATILADPPLCALAERAMREVVAAGNADLAAAGSAALLDEEAVVRSMFRQTEAIGDYHTSMCIDFQAGRELEVEAILGEPLRCARGHGLVTPMLEALYAVVRAAGRSRALAVAGNAP